MGAGVQRGRGAEVQEVQRCKDAEVQRWCRGQRCRGGAEEVQRCRTRGLEVQRSEHPKVQEGCRGAEVQKCKGLVV